MNIRYLLIVLVAVLVTACNSGEKQCASVDEVTLPKEYNTWDKIKIFFGNHDKSIAYCNYAIKACNDGLEELAIQKCRYVAENDSEFWFAHYYKGRMEYNTKLYKEACIDLMKAEQLNPKNEYFYDYDSSFFNRHNICRSLGWSIVSYVAYECNEEDSIFENSEIALSLAIEYLQESLKYECGSDSNYYIENAYHGIVIAYSDLGKINEAKIWANKVLERNKYKGYFLLGYINDKAGRYNEAIENYEKLLELDPTDSGALNNLSICYYSIGNYSKSLEIRKKAAILGDEFAIEWLKDRGIEY